MLLIDVYLVNYCLCTTSSHRIDKLSIMSLTVNTMTQRLLKISSKNSLIMCRLLTEIFLCISIAVRKFTKKLSLIQKGTDDAHFQVHAFILVHKVFACIATHNNPYLSFTEPCCSPSVHALSQTSSICSSPFKQSPLCLSQLIGCPSQSLAWNRRWGGLLCSQPHNYVPDITV